MKLQEKLIELAEYGISFNMHSEHVFVTVTYKPGWSVIKPTDDTITFKQDDENENRYYYSAPMTTDMSAIFSAIDETISYNKELEEKVVLFGQVVENLQEVFAELPISLLRRLTFSIPEEEKPKPKQRKARETTPKKASSKRKKKEPKPEETVVAEENSKIDEIITLAIKEKEAEANVVG